MGWITVKCSKCGGSGLRRGSSSREHFDDQCTECRGKGTDQVDETEARSRLLQKQIDDAGL